MTKHVIIRRAPRLKATSRPAMPKYFRATRVLQEKAKQPSLAVANYDQEEFASSTDQSSMPRGFLDIRVPYRTVNPPDLDIERVERRHLRAATLYRRVTGKAALVGDDGLPILPHCLSQVDAAKEMSWLIGQLPEIERMISDGWHPYAVTLIERCGQAGADRLNPELHKKVRDSYRRKLPPLRRAFGDDAVVSLGVTDICLNQEVGLFDQRVWQVHVHALIMIRCGDPERAKAMIRAALKPRRFKIMGRHRPVMVKNVFYLSGWLYYVVKALQLGTIVRRSSWKDPAGNKQTKKQGLPSPEKAVLAAHLMTVPIEDRRVLAGWQKRDGKLRRI